MAMSGLLPTKDQIYGFYADTIHRTVGSPIGVALPVGYFKEAPTITLTIQPFVPKAFPGKHEILRTVTKDGFEIATENSISAGPGDDTYYVHYIAVGVIDYKPLPE